MSQALLPPGFYDVLPPEAEQEAEVVQTLMTHFKKAGYARVAAPLIEFEESLLSGPGEALSSSTFRVMDPISQCMLGLRTDHTLQIGRIASTRLSDSERPLRLSYAGPVVSAAASGQMSARQKMQVGVELIGSLEPETDAEVIKLAASGLKALGVSEISADLLLPTLVPALAEAAGVEREDQEQLYRALDRKDEAAVKNLTQAAGLSLHAKRAHETALQLLQAGGAPEKALAFLESLALPEKAKADRERIKKVLALLDKTILARLSVDLVERRCFEYQSGLSFSFFSKNAEGVLGRGGRYRTQSGEPATGFTFYAETLAKVLG